MDNQDDLLAMALAELPLEQTTAATTTAKPTTQFTLASLPFVSIYLQGPALYSDALLPVTTDGIPAWTAATLATGQLRIRRIGYRPIPHDAAADLVGQLTNIINRHGLLSLEYRTYLSVLIKDVPILWDSIGGADGLLTKAVSAERALAAIKDWQAYATTLPIATPADTPTTVEPLADVDLNSLLGLD